MGNEIEFEATLEYHEQYEGRRVRFGNCIYVPSSKADRVGTRYKVTLEPIEPELKPCPFCGCEAELLDLNGPGEFGTGVVRWQVECRGCSTLSNAFPTRALAIKAWNRRASDE